MKKLTIAMLSNQAPSSPEATNFDDNFDDLTNQVPGGLDTLDIAMQDLEAIDETISNVIDVSMELKVEQEVLEQAQQQEPLSQTALESIQRSVQRLAKRAGIDSPVTFALESYSNSRYNGLSMESAVKTVKDFIARIWKAVMEAFNKVKGLITTLLKGYFDESVKVKKSAQILIKKALSLQGKVAPATAKVGSFNLSNFMRFNNQPLKPDTLVANFDKWTDWSHEFIENIAGSDAITDYTDYVAKSVKVLESAKDHKNPHKLEAEIDEINNKMLRRVYDNLIDKKTIPNGALYQTKPILGDIKYTFNTVNMEFSIEKIDNYKDIPVEKTHDLLGVMDAHDLCVKINDHMDSYKKVDQYIKDLENLEKGISKLANASLSSDKMVDYLDNKIITRLTSTTIKLFIKAIGKVGAGARKHDMNVDKAVLEWCSLSLRVL